MRGEARRDCGEVAWKVEILLDSLPQKPGFYLFGTVHGN